MQFTPFELESTLKCVSEQGENSANQKYLMFLTRYTSLLNVCMRFLGNLPHSIWGYTTMVLDPSNSHPVICMSCCSLSSYFTQTVARGGITVSAIFNYKLTPELSTEVCHQNSQIEINKCIKIHHEWANNKIVLVVWYQLRKIKMCSTLGMTYVSVQRVAIFVHN